MTEKIFDRPGHDLMADYLQEQMNQLSADLRTITDTILRPQTDGPRLHAAREAVKAYARTMDTLRKARAIYRATREHD